MTKGRINAEAQLADTLDRIAAELNRIAERLRRTGLDFSSVEMPLWWQGWRLESAKHAGQMLRLGSHEYATEVLDKISKD